MSAKEHNVKEDYAKKVAPKKSILRMACNAKVVVGGGFYDVGMGCDKSYQGGKLVNCVEDILH